MGCIQNSYKNKMRLPVDIIVMISSQLDYATMLSLSLTSNSIFQALKLSLVRRKYRCINIEKDYPMPFPFHLLLDELLHDDKLASYVETLICDEDVQIYDSWRYQLSKKEEEACAERMSEFDADMRTLLSDKMAQMPWFTEEQRVKLLDRVFSPGNESAALVVLLCLLVELRSLTPPLFWGDDVQEFVETVVRYHGSQIASNNDVESMKAVSMPLNKLQIFKAWHTANGELGFYLEDAFVGMCLPNLKRVYLWHCHTHGLHIDELTTKSLIRAPEIYLCESSVDLQSVTDFARFIQGPCMIRQTFKHDHGGYPTEIEWDHCEITGDIACGDERVESSVRKVNIELRYPVSEQHRDPSEEHISPIAESPTWTSMNRSGYWAIDWSDEHP